MKKVFAFVLILMLCVGAIAEGMTPAMFIGSRGFVAMDENRLNSMNTSEDSQPLDGKKLGGLKMCMYSPGGEQSSEVIMFTDNDVYYAAFDMMGAFSGQSSGTAMAQTFIDMCDAFDFDIYMFGSGTEPMAVYGDKEALIKMMESFDTPEETMLKFLENESGFCESKEDFINIVKNYIK